VGRNPGVIHAKNDTAEDLITTWDGLFSHTIANYPHYDLGELVYSASLSQKEVSFVVRWSNQISYVIIRNIVQTLTSSMITAESRAWVCFMGDLISETIPYTV
jgi:hypothetical protein